MCVVSRETKASSGKVKSEEDRPLLDAEAKKNATE